MNISLRPIKLNVRDYECDLQGVVNNAVYLHYYEHARSQIFSELGTSLEEQVVKGLLLSVAELTIRYLKPLRAGESICIESVVHAKGVMRLIFQQQISAQGRVCNQATVTVAAVKNGVPQPLDWLLERLRAKRKVDV